MLTRYIIPVILISLQCVTGEFTLDNLELALANISEDGRLDFCELLNKYNYPCVEYEVVTEDGYILRLMNKPGDKTKPVLLQHGFVDSSDTWILRGQDSMAACLANNTYDIWFGNTRGNMHSRAHKTLNPELLRFWETSFHEMAIYDMPATIDFILEKTEQTQLQVIAHSQGTTLFFILGAVKPEFVSKIKNVICLAPVVYLNHAQQPLFSMLSPPAGGSLVGGALGLVGHGEFLRNSSALVALVRTACTQGALGYAACGQVVLPLLFGYDPAQLEAEFLRTLFGHYPCGSPLRNLVHFLQILTAKRFQQYDHGSGNLLMYGSIRPPAYDLSKVPFNISLFVGKNDRLSAIEDVARLRSELTPQGTNVVEYYVMPYDNWNHYDFVGGKFMAEYLFKPVLDTLTKYF